MSKYIKDTKGLQRGNLISFKGRLAVIESINAQSLSFIDLETKSNGFSVLNKDLEYVPITPELLERLGFAISESKKVWFIDDGASGKTIEVVKMQYNNECFYKIEVWSGVYYCNVLLKYAHQLQNAIHIMTGEELTIGAVK